MTQSKVQKKTKLKKHLFVMIFHVWFFCLFDMNKHKSKQGRECFILTEFDLRFVSCFSPLNLINPSTANDTCGRHAWRALVGKKQTLNLHVVSFCCQICQNDRYPKDTYDTLQFSSLWHHPSITKNITLLDRRLWHASVFILLENMFHT